MPSPAPRSQSDSAPITFVVHGQPQAVGGITRGGDEASPLAPSLPGRIKASVRLGASRGPAGEPQRLTAVPGEDVVLLHIAGGPVLMLHPATARDLMLAQGGLARGAQAGEVTVSAQLRWRGLESGAPTRGLLGDVVLSAFELLTGAAKDKAVAFVASEVVRSLDAQVDAGVYALAPEALQRLKGSGRKLAHVPASASPMLVLIHGTFVETTSTFGQLWALHPQRVRQLFEHYGGRVYALDHPTLGASPIGNALTLVDALPRGARLHLATHSRGGLVAEVLARVAHQGEVRAADLAAFAGDAYARQRAELQQLAAQMKSKHIRVERIVRVACPARGTLVASRRLDAYLSVLKWTLDLAGVPVVPRLLDFIAEVARRRADPAAIPGLEAMIPETPLVRWLNAAPGAIDGELRVVAGDLDGDSIGSWIKTLLADVCYRTDNDLVVQTSSMYAGAPRAGGASFLLDQGGKTTHFGYFANPRTVDAVVDGLISSTLPTGYQTIGPLSWAGVEAGGDRAAQRAERPEPDRPAVFVLPGILGSNLKVDNQRVWLSLRIVGGLGRLAYRADHTDRVLPDGPISPVYGKLIEHLRGSHEVIPFAFDWRRPMEQEAARLADAIEAALDARNQSGQPVRLLAHSMGGLVARTVQLVRPALWARMMAHDGARLVMLGTPNGGSWVPMQVLSGDDTFGNALSALGSPLADHRARELMAEMPGFLQLQAGLLDPALKLDQAETWARLAKDDFARVQAASVWHQGSGEAVQGAFLWGVPAQAVLDQALALRRKLDAQRDGALAGFAAKLALVVGQAKYTPVGFELGEQGLVYLDAADGGDGRVPLASALLPAVKTWRLDAEHGSLPSTKVAFEAFVELLGSGHTQRLEPLETARGEATPMRVKSRPSRASRSSRPPQAEDSVFRIADLPGPASRASTGAALQIEVLNGNLAFQQQPLMVGHYRSSELTGTEAIVNRLIGGAMKSSLDIGLYPEAPGSQSVYVNAFRDPANPWRTPRPEAVVVVGLGDEGALRESDLTNAVRSGVLAWAARQVERAIPAGAAGALSATLLGSGGLGVTTGASALALARGVREANLRLAAIGWPVVSRLTLVEIYLDRATEAWRSLHVLASASPEAYVLAPQIKSGTGPLRRQLEAGYRGTDYDLITAITTGEGTVEFAFDTRRARTEVRAQRTQTKLVRDLVRRAASARGDDPALGRTLFQLLVPGEIEPFLGGLSRMVLDLDAGTAAIPWELLDSGTGASGDDRRPWAIRAQLLRRLRKTAVRGAHSDAVSDAGADGDVLIIGEPQLDAGSPYPPLPGAREEAQAVQEALVEARNGIAPERLTSLVAGPSATEVVNALLARPWRIVHIAGHGESLADGGRGVVLSDGLFLGPAEIRSMRTVPELVFVNCCHLAAYGGEAVLQRFDPALFAAGLADQLITIGVRCVVAAGWAVEDGPAATFGRAFYEALLRGARFIDAVSQAREQAWLEAPQGKTWAAYQCYGDPNWVFRRATGDAQAPRARADAFELIPSPSALALALETLVVQSRFMGAPEQAQRESIRQLEARHGPAWGGIGAVAEAFGVAWEAAGGREEAIGWLERAVAANDASASMKAEETLENLSARQAWSSAAAAAGAAAATGGDGLAPRQRAQLSKALDNLRSFAARRPTPERLALLGSACKRLALLDRQGGEVEAEHRALERALEAYRQAEQMSATAGAPDLFYPALNRMALELVLHATGPDRQRAWRGFDARSSAMAQASLQTKALRDPDFWSMVGLIELQVYLALAEQRIAAAAPALLSAFADLHGRVQARSYWGSVADQAQFVLARFAHVGSEADRRAVVGLWQRLLDYAGVDGQAAVPPQPRAKRRSMAPDNAEVRRERELQRGGRELAVLRERTLGEATGIVMWHARADARLARDIGAAMRARGQRVALVEREQGPAALRRELSQARLCLALFHSRLPNDDDTVDALVAMQDAAWRQEPPLRLVAISARSDQVPALLAEARHLGMKRGGAGMSVLIDAVLEELARLDPEVRP